MGTIILSPADRIRLVRKRMKQQLGEDCSDQELIELMEEAIRFKKLTLVKKICYDFASMSQVIDYLKNPPKIVPVQAKVPKSMLERYPLENPEPA